MHIKCLECGAESAEVTEVCTRCGAPIILRPPATADPAAGGSGDPIAPLAGRAPRQLAGQRAEPGYSRRDALIMVGVGVVMLAAVTAVIATSSSPASSTSSGQHLTEDQLRAGACLAGSDLGLGTSNPWPGLVTAVPCAQRHIAEVYFAADIWPQSAAYQGDDETSNQALDRCGNEYLAYIAGSAHSTAEFAYDEITPDSTTWRDGDRRVVCVAYKVTDQDRGGAPVTYSIKGTRQ
jgi:hypothetical protein